MTLRFDPASYPGPRPSGPVLIHDGAVHRVALGAASVPVDDAEVEAPVLDPGRVRFVVAYGANASPPRLLDKGLDRCGALLLPARLAGWAPAFEQRRTSYGAVPLTLVPHPEHVVTAWVLGVDVDDLPVLDGSEGRVAEQVPLARTPEPSGDPVRAPTGAYVLGRVGEVAVADRFRLPDALAYLPGPSTDVQLTDDGRWRIWPEHDQAAASAHVDARGPAEPAPAAARPVVGPWPETTLEDLPLFVYGTLRPDRAAFELVADLVEVVAEATVPGHLHDTGHGWPAAHLVAPQRADLGAEGVVQGVLLQPRAPDDTPVLLERVDRYEGAPALFRRTVVLAETVDGTRWALAYTWADGAPPGPRLPGGRWA